MENPNTETNKTRRRRQSETQPTEQLQNKPSDTPFFSKLDLKKLQTLMIANKRNYGRLEAAWGVASAQVDELFRAQGWD